MAKDKLEQNPREVWRVTMLSYQCQGDCTVFTQLRVEIARQFRPFCIRTGRKQYTKRKRMNISHILFALLLLKVILNQQCILVLEFLRLKTLTQY